MSKPLCDFTSLPQGMFAITNYGYWNWMQEKTPTDWAETSAIKIVNGTRPHTPITNTIGITDKFYNTLYRPQQVVKQMKDVKWRLVKIWN